MSRPIGLAKTGGRKAGTPNRKTADLVAELSKAGLDVVKEITLLLPKLDEPKRVDVLVGLMAYLYPKRKAVEHNVESETPKSLTIRFVESDGKGGIREVDPSG